MSKTKKLYIALFLIIILMIGMVVMSITSFIDFTDDLFNSKRGTTFIAVYYFGLIIIFGLMLKGRMEINAEKKKERISENGGE